MMYIYKTRNIVNGKQYVGMSTKMDDNYLGSGKLIKDAIKKYGKENFEKTVLEYCDDFNTLCEREIYWIDYYGAADSEEFYNIAKGGNGGNRELLREYWSSMTETERKEARKWNGHFITNTFEGFNDPIWRNKVSNGVTESWAKMSPEEKTTRNKKSAETRKKHGVGIGNTNGMYGRSIVKEKNLKWYTDGIETIYVTENTQPEGFVRGRKLR
jgi:group I intron endonuclease